MRDTIYTVVNGQTLNIKTVAPYKMVLPWLREKGYISVKEGCGEGDCGACTVALGTLQDGKIQWKSVTSCLLFIPMIDGKILMTVEGLQRNNGKPHPVQEAMAESFGTQCGFCSPGFTMSLFVLGQKGLTEKEEILDEISGNLCRCTGYRPIIDVAESLQPCFEGSDLQEQAQWLKEMTQEPLNYLYEGKGYYVPKKLSDALDFRSHHPEAWILSGGTDLGLYITKKHKEPETILATEQIEPMTTIRVNESSLSIGAAVTYSDCLSYLKEFYPQFSSYVRRIGGAQIRYKGTFGGNLGTASPISDTIPALIALNARIAVVGLEGIRYIDAENFVTAYRQTVLKSDEMILSIDIPFLPQSHHFYSYKVAKRFDQDISAVSASFDCHVEKGYVESFRAAYGGVAAKPIRAIKLERALIGKEWTEKTVQHYSSVVLEDITPQSDLRGSDSYRQTVAINLIERLYHETTARKDTPVRLDQCL